MQIDKNFDHKLNPDKIPEFNRKYRRWYDKDTSFFIVESDADSILFDADIYLEQVRVSYSDFTRYFEVKHGAGTRLTEDEMIELDYLASESMGHRHYDTVDIQKLVCEWPHDKQLFAYSYIYQEYREFQENQLAEEIRDAKLRHEYYMRDLANRFDRKIKETQTTLEVEESEE